MEPAEVSVVPLSRSAIESAAFVLWIMAFNTMLWTIVSYIGLRHTVFWIPLLLFPASCVVFIRKTLLLSGIAKLLPKTDPSDKSPEEKKRGKWFNIIYAGEGAGILLAINIVNNIGHSELIVPAIALVVALHFFPLAKVFKRNVLYYIASWSTLVAVSGFIFSLGKLVPDNIVMGITGAGMALATSADGVYTLRIVRNFGVQAG